MHAQKLLGLFLFGALAAGCGGGTTTPTTTDMAMKPADLSMPPPVDMAMSPDLAPMTWTVMVGLNGNTFSPATLPQVRVGDKVMWVWSASGHNVVSGTIIAGVATADNKFCSPNDTNCATAATSASGFTYSHTFNAAGSYPYFCRPHAGAGMTGTITVN